MFYIAKKELTAFPFDKFYEFVDDRIKEGIAALDNDARRMHEKDVERRIALIFSAHEGSYEGNPEDDFPFPGIDPEMKAKEVDRLRKTAASLFLEKYEIKSNASWLMPQFVAYVARLPISKNEMGKYDPQSLKDSLSTNTFNKGIWLLGMHHARGEIISKQYTSEMRTYSALVPLLLMPFKKFDNIKYSDWDASGLHKVVDPTLWSAMQVDFDTSEISKAELLEVREQGLKIKSGKGEGGSRNPLTTHRLYGIGHPYGKLPWVAQAMLFQIWCAHPSQRTELMVLDWKDWDNMPDPLIEKDVLKTPTIKPVIDIPWDV